MNDSASPQVVVVGSVAFDSVKTNAGERRRMLGGSASYAALASALFARTGLVGIVGEDFPEECWKVYRDAGIDLAGMEKSAGKTFYWEAEYAADMDSRTTLCTELGAFAGFDPVLPEGWRDAPVLVLGNIAPSLQARVLDQARPRLSVLDTMELWIDTARGELDAVLARVDLLTVNEHEARALTGEGSLLRAADALLKAGPKWVLVKKGSHGAFLVGRDGERDILMVPSWPLREVKDPTGAGDSFAGAFAGVLASALERGESERAAFRDALAWATVVAARTCGEFGTDALVAAEREGIVADREAFSEMLVR
ncbi:MAG: bifunctional hydroxymethylpyrimidine kinase/phosphomethylpyrimidine kinase [Kiritimatiellae bacterium]|nr:bifunctional hydroxymethylpyrimidine kinase/phosphomethylpyrimidine kinase [Kiritimatiellia bacterium]